MAFGVSQTPIKIIVVKGEIWTVDVETLEDVERILEGLEVQL